jgi:hypothetical protein
LKKINIKKEVQIGPFAPLYSDPNPSLALLLNLLGLRKVKKIPKHFAMVLPTLKHKTQSK